MFRKTTLREVKILRMLRHPNIVSLTEAFRRKGESIDGNRSLKQVRILTELKRICIELGETEVSLPVINGMKVAKDRSTENN